MATTSTTNLNASNLAVAIIPLGRSVYGDKSILVEVMTAGIPVDRPVVMGWVVPATHCALAERLKAAILAGRVFDPATIRTDVNGKTYMSANAHVMGKRMNADLRRLGF